MTHGKRLAAVWLVVGLLVSALPAAADIVYETGYFEVTEQDGRWWLIDPDGERFYSLGVNLVNPHAYNAPDLGYAPYYENILDIYGSESAWADELVNRFEAWGFNTMGSWSDVGLLGDRLPYTYNLGLSGHDWQSGTIPDYWGQAFLDRVASIVTSTVVPRADDSMLVGWFFDNEMRWGVDIRGIRDLVYDYFTFAADAPGKIALVDFLRSKYGNDVQAFNAAWGFDVASFDDLLDITEVSPVAENQAQYDDRYEFTALAAKQYFKTCHDAVRAADPNHLLLGSRFISWLTPRVVLDEIVPYTDVISINHYIPWDLFMPMLEPIFDWLDIPDTGNQLAEFHEQTGKPLMVSEFSIRGEDAGLPNSWPPKYFFKVVATQAERGQFYSDFAYASFRSGYMVGHHWFAWMDEPPEGRFDGEDSNFGIVDNWDDPWMPLVTRMQAANADALVWPLPDDDDDAVDDDDMIDDDDAVDDDDTVDDDDLTDDDDVVDDDDVADDDDIVDDDDMTDDDDTDDDAVDDDDDASAVSGNADDDDDDGCGC